MNVKWGNFAKTTITTVGGISAIATAIDVADASVFPSVSGSEYVYVVLRRASDGAREIVKVTAVSGDTLTVVRAQESTTALVFAQGDEVIHAFTAGTLTDIVDEQQDAIDANSATAATALATAEAAAVNAAAALAKFPVQAADFGAGEIPTAALDDGAVTTDKIAADAVTNEKIADGSVDTAQLAADAVTDDKIDPSALNWVPGTQYGEDKIGEVLPAVGTPLDRPSMVTVWLYRSSGTGIWRFDARISATSDFSSYQTVIQFGLAAAFDTNEICNATFPVPKGYYFKIVKLDGTGAVICGIKVNKMGTNA